MNARTMRLRRLQRRARRGMTLVEIMIVVIIMALIAGGVAAAVLPRLAEARIRQTRTDALAVQSAVVMYLAQEPGADCPTVDQLVETSMLDRSRRVQDAWERDFVIECEGTDILVSSSGPDGQMGTEDDVRGSGD